MTAIKPTIQSDCKTARLHDFSFLNHPFHAQKEAFKAVKCLVLRVKIQIIR